MVADGHAQALGVVALQDVQRLHADLHPSWNCQNLCPGPTAMVMAGQGTVVRCLTWRL